MKKVLALLALALATLPSLAETTWRRVEYGGYRIGDSAVLTNETRVRVSGGLPFTVSDASQDAAGKTLSAAQVTGQKIVRWWSYGSIEQVPATHTVPAHIQYNNVVTNFLAVYSPTWHYGTVSYSPAYLVVDYDYITYTLSYNANGGTGTVPSASNNVIYTNNVTIAANPFTKTGYTFDGWTNSLTSKVWKGDESVTGSTLGLQSIVDGSNVVLRAKWTANKYKVQFNANGGSGSMDAQSFTYGKAKTLTTNSFTRTGYTFAGWNTKADGTGTSYSDKQSVSNLTATQNGTVTLYAKWSLVYYALTASATGTGSGTVSLNPSGGSYTNGTVVVVTATPASGSTFTGWSDGETVNPRTYTVTNDMAVAAEFAIQTFTVTFKDYDETVLLSQVCGWGVDMPYPAADPSREGYRFLGWTPTPPDTVTRTATYYANYQANPYTVKFHANTGDGEDVVQEQSFTYGTQQALVQASTLRFTKTGYAFSHWRDEGGTIYQDGEEVLNLATGGSFDLYAVWTPIGYVIEFDGNGAEAGSVDDIAAVYDRAYALSANGFARSGFNFTGWRFGNATYAVGASVSNLTTTAGATVTFSAIWSELRYAAFDGHGADNAEAMIDDVLTFDGVETHALVSNRFEKTGYTFGGWATNETDAAALNATYADGADVASTNLWNGIGETNVFSAVWQTNAYTVVFSANGGAGEMEPQAFFYDQPQALSPCAFTSSLEFRGWATNETDEVVFTDCAAVSNLTAEANGTVTLSAVWDNGELSQAMHCRNLVWVQKETGAEGMAEWTIVKGADEGYNLSGSSVSCSIDYWEDIMQSTRLALREGTTGSGKLSFWYKATQAGTDPYWFSFESDGQGPTNLNLQTNWTPFGPVDVADLSTVAIYLALDTQKGDDCTVWIDQMTWVPAGAEPTEADRPVVSGFTPATTGGFTLSVDPANISGSFRYQILATNELVSGEWPIKANLSADELKAGYAITPEAGEPTMFYKVKVIAK